MKLSDTNAKTVNYGKSIITGFCYPLLFFIFSTFLIKIELHLSPFSLPPSTSSQVPLSQLFHGYSDQTISLLSKWEPLFHLLLLLHTYVFTLCVDHFRALLFWWDYEQTNVFAFHFLFFFCSSVINWQDTKYSYIYLTTVKIISHIPNSKILKIGLYYLQLFNMKAYF